MLALIILTFLFRWQRSSSEMTEKELDIASPGLQRENKSRNKSQTNAELTIEVGRNFENTILNLHATTFTDVSFYTSL